MSATLTISDELARELGPWEKDLNRLIRAGIRVLSAETDAEFTDVSAVLEKLASLPSPEEVLALRPSAKLQTYVNELLAKNRQPGGLDEQEQKDWEQIQYIEHLVRMAKGQALLRLQGKKAS